jgi:aspartate aminotransferase
MPTKSAATRSARKTEPAPSVIAHRVAIIEESATLAVSDRARVLKAQGIDVVSLSAGEPDFDTPPHIKAAAIQALEEGFTKYTASSGIPALREAVAKKFLDDNGLAYKPDEIMISCGAKHSLYNIFLTLIDDGDETLIPAPYWTSYPEMVKAAGGKPVIVPTTEKDGFRMRPEALKKHITKKTRALILNSPSNPTGSVYTEDELRALAKVLEPTGVWVVSDDIYEKLVYGGARFVNIAALSEQVKARAVVVNGVSKTYAMTGWRIGYAAGPKAVIEAAGRLQSQSTSNPTSIAQKAALAALQGDQGCIAQMAAEYDTRRRHIVKRLNAIPGVSCIEPHGAFYAFPRVSGLYGKKAGGVKIDGSFTLANLLLDQARLAIVPGAAFGDDAFIRLSYATSLNAIDKGLDRLEDFARSLR